MKHDTAGDPITGIQWSRRTTRKIAEQLGTLGISVSKNTVGRLLKGMNYKLRVNPTSAVFCTIFREIAANLFGLNIGLTDFEIVTKTTAVYIDQY